MQILPQHTPELHLSCPTTYLLFLQGSTLPTYTAVPEPEKNQVYIIHFHENLFVKSTGHSKEKIYRYQMNNFTP